MFPTKIAVGWDQHGALRVAELQHSEYTEITPSWSRAATLARPWLLLCDRKQCPYNPRSDGSPKRFGGTWGGEAGKKSHLVPASEQHHANTCDASGYSERIALQSITLCSVGDSVLNLRLTSFFSSFAQARAALLQGRDLQRRTVYKRDRLPPLTLQLIAYDRRKSTTD